MEIKPQNSPAEPLEKGESRNMASAQKEEKSELIRLAKENLDYTKLIYEDTQKIRRFMFWRLIINIFWIILVIAPIIVSLIWLPSLLKNYSQMFTGGQSMDEIFKMLK